LPPRGIAIVILPLHWAH